MIQLPAKFQNLKTFSAYIDSSQLTAWNPSKLEWIYEATSNLPLSVEHVSLKISGDMQACEMVDWARIKRNVGDGSRLVLVTAQVDWNGPDLILIHPR
jgi:hypothetical protein